MSRAFGCAQSKRGDMPEQPMPGAGADNPDELGTSPEAEEQDGQPSGVEEVEEVDYDELEPDKLREMLQEKDRKLAESEKNRRGFQSTYDRQLEELRDGLRKSEEREAKFLEYLERANRGDEPAPEDAAAQKLFNDEWRNKLAENPGTAVDYMQGAFQELTSLISQKLDSLSRQSDGKLLEIDPELRGPQGEAIKQLIKKGLSRDEARDIVQKIGGNGKPGQPDTPEAPRGTPEAVRTPSRKVVQEQYEPDPVSAAAINMALGNDAKRMKSILKRVNQDLAGVSE